MIDKTITFESWEETPFPDRNDPKNDNGDTLGDSLADENPAPRMPPIRARSCASKRYGHTLLCPIR